MALYGSKAVAAGLTAAMSAALGFAAGLTAAMSAALGFLTMPFKGTQANSLKVGK